MRLKVLIATLVWATLNLTGCSNNSSEPDENHTQAPISKPAATLPFTIDPPDTTAAAERSTTEIGWTFRQVQDELGIAHVYENGAQGGALISETIGGGCGWLDYDNDGRPDLYLNQAGTYGRPTATLIDRLFQNQSSLSGETFRDITRFSRISELNYSQGLATADFDNDGFVDIYVTNIGSDTFWRNCGDGTFIEVAAATGLLNDSWGTSAAWADLNQDGALDLYVCNYCEFDPLSPVQCQDRDGRPTLCNPAELEPASDVCFISTGDGTFRESSRELGLSGPGNRSLGVAIADFNNDSYADLYIANDTTENFLFINNGNGQFTDEATLRGCAVDRTGAPQGSMGLAVADLDRNGFLDIYSTHYFEESNTLYANFGDRGFQDITALSGLHKPTLEFLGFGTVFADFSLDGQEELIIANGHVDHSQRVVAPKMPPQLFRQNISGRWAEISHLAGDFFQNKYMGRGLACADYDADGDLDVAIANENDPTVLLRTDLQDSSSNHWIQIHAVGRKSNRDAVGTRITLLLGKDQHMQEICGGTSFAAAQHRVACFGLGSHDGEVTVEITWPSGKCQKIQTPCDQVLTVVEP